MDPKQEIRLTMRRIQVILESTKNHTSQKDQQFRRNLRKQYKNLQRELA